MAGIVDAACPGCKKVLRIPADWLQQLLRCKHCGMVVSARPVAQPVRSAVPAAAPVAPTPRYPRAPSIPVAMPVAPPPRAAFPPPAPLAADAFANLHDAAGDSSSAFRRRRRRRSKGALFGLILLATAAVLAVVYWPLLKDLAGQAKEQIATLDDDGKNTAKAETKSEKPP
ncbi:MAG TPA: hypothetical protein VKE94_13405, partial [Gemmataceae bacterium]|nr:hypothetical protein [Gemmataceae bacterium]